MAVRALTGFDGAAASLGGCGFDGYSNLAFKDERVFALAGFDNKQAQVPMNMTNATVKTAGLSFIVLVSFPVSNCFYIFMATKSECVVFYQVIPHM